jgi:hypothetical protein
LRRSLFPLKYSLPWKNREKRKENDEQEEKGNWSKKMGKGVTQKN